MIVAFLRRLLGLSPKSRESDRGQRVEARAGLKTLRRLSFEEICRSHKREFTSLPKADQLTIVRKTYPDATDAQAERIIEEDVVRPVRLGM